MNDCCKYATPLPFFSCNFAAPFEKMVRALLRMQLANLLRL